MPKLDVVDLENNVVGEVELADAVFNSEINRALLYQAVHHYRNELRSGTHKTKGRGEIRGGGRKPWRQKGTGRARAGSNRSPLWRGGGTVHGPQPRSYGYHLPHKMLLGALRSALSVKLADGALKVVKNFDLAAPKTKEFSGALDRLGVGATVLLVNNGENEKLRLSSRNIPGVTLLESRDMHPYHLLRCKTVILSEAAVQHCSEVLR
jgi:large subunit ribosomal protein L4